MRGGSAAAQTPAAGAAPAGTAPRPPGWRKCAGQRHLRDQPCFVAPAGGASPHPPHGRVFSWFPRRVACWFPRRVARRRGPLPDGGRDGRGRRATGVAGRVIRRYARQGPCVKSSAQAEAPPTVGAAPRWRPTPSVGPCWAGSDRVGSGLFQVVSNGVGSGQVSGCDVLPDAASISSCALVSSFIANSFSALAPATSSPTLG